MFAKEKSQFYADKKRKQNEKPCDVKYITVPL